MDLAEVAPEAEEQVDDGKVNTPHMNLLSVRLYSGVLVLGIVCMPFSVHASILSRFTDPITAQKVVVLDVPSNTLLVEKNGYEKWPIASLTKLMTAAVFLDTHTSFNKKVTIKTQDHSIGSRIGFKTGAVVRAGDLFNAMLMVSANDAAKALVRSTGLSHSAFIKKMNTKARSWGLMSTTFVEETGLDARNVSTAVDYAHLAQKAFDNSLISTTTVKKTYSFKDIKTGKKYAVKNLNPLIGSPLAITATKTGFIDESDLNLVARSQAQGRNIIAVVLGSLPGAYHHFKEVRGLLDAALQEPAPPVSKLITRS